MRLLVECHAIRHGSVKVRMAVLNGGDASTKTGIGELNMRHEWWARLRHVLRAGCELDALALDLIDGTERPPEPGTDALAPK